MTDSGAPDRALPFMLEGTNVRGRIVYLHRIADTIIARHLYPAIIKRLLAETMVIASMLSTNLKHEGMLTIQMKGEGPVTLVVVDVVHGGGLRGYAELADGAAAQLETMPNADLQALFGAKGYLAITLEPGEGLQRYQGVVALEGASIANAVEAYFTHSQQIDVAFKIATETVGEHIRTGGMMIERMPEEGGIAASHDDADDAWRYAQAMLMTLKNEELTDPMLPQETVLERLYHEQGIVVYEAKVFSGGCRCSRERIHNLLMSMSDIERAEMLVDGTASVHCQFCNTTQDFTGAELGLKAH